MADKKLRVFKLRTQTHEELKKGLEEYKKELSNLRTLEITAGRTSSKLSKIRVVRKAIAKHLTVINQKNRGEVKASLKKAKYLPRDLRVKKTRALRRKLTKHQAGARTLRQIKKDSNHPVRKFALKA